MLISKHKNFTSIFTVLHMLFVGWQHKNKVYQKLARINTLPGYKAIIRTRFRCDIHAKKFKWKI
jgi:hypothetical protein